MEFEKVNELLMAKIAFQKGYTQVFYDEDGSDNKVASPGSWLIDSCAVSDFVADYEIMRTETDQGDFFEFTDQQYHQLLAEIKLAQALTVDELLACS